eukprot:3977938-Alexandrium_andersonii.AAC.1
MRSGLNAHALLPDASTNCPSWVGRRPLASASATSSAALCTCSAGKHQHQAGTATRAHRPAPRSPCWSWAASQCPLGRPEQLWSA